MLKEKLKELKKQKKTSEIKYTPLISFIEDNEYDEETMFDMITFPTTFLKESRMFNPEFMKANEIPNFKSKIHSELLNAYEYADDEFFDYYLEYLLTRYKLDTFAPSLLLFFLIPFEKYFTQIKTLDNVTFNFLKGIEVYSKRIFVNLYKKNPLFRNNFLAFYESSSVNNREINIFIDEIKNE